MKEFTISESRADRAGRARRGKEADPGSLLLTTELELFGAKNKLKKKLRLEVAEVNRSYTKKKTTGRHKYELTKPRGRLTRRNQVNVD